ncbi:MAG: pentapeptide repeat-containing protein [Clostridium sp.]
MSYINFKEECEKGRIQLSKRIENNKWIFDKQRRERVSWSGYSFDREWSYREFEGNVFGGGHVKGEDEFKEICDSDIVCTIFRECKFSNIKFRNCRFIGCYFYGCDFEGGGASFENCIFIKEESEVLPSLNRKDNFSCTFEGGNIYARFFNCSLNYAIFKGCKIHNTNFELTDMTSVIIFECDLKRVVFTDCDISGMKVIGTYIEDLDFCDKDKTRIDEKTFMDKIRVRRGTRDEYEGLYEVYEIIADQFKENQLNNNFGEYYFLCKCVQRKTLKPIPKMLSYINFFTSGYGERPSYAVLCSLFIILVFAFVYLFTGIDIEGEIIRYSLFNFNVELGSFLKHFNETLNLSVGMFAAVGVNVSQPTEVGYMLANIEMIIGVIMMGIGIGALVKKLVR